MAIGKKWALKEHLVEDETTFLIYDEDVLIGGIGLSNLELKELIWDLLRCLKLNISRIKK